MLEGKKVSISYSTYLGGSGTYVCVRIGDRVISYESYALI